MSDMKLGLQMWSIHDVCIEKRYAGGLRLIREWAMKALNSPSATVPLWKNGAAPNRQR